MDLYVTRYIHLCVAVSAVHSVGSFFGLQLMLDALTAGGI